MAFICWMQGLFWPVSLALMSRSGRYLLREVAALARIGGRLQPRSGICSTGRCVALRRASPPAAPAVVCRVSLAVMSRVGRYLLCEEAALARIAGRYEPWWPLRAVRSGRSGPYRWPL